MSTLASTFLAEGEHEQLWQLPMPAWAYGAIALGAFLLLLLLTWFFRNAGHAMVYGPGGVKEGADPHAPGAQGHGHHSGAGH